MKRMTFDLLSLVHTKEVKYPACIVSFVTVVRKNAFIKRYSVVKCAILSCVVPVGLIGTDKVLPLGRKYDFLYY